MATLAPYAVIELPERRVVAQTLLDVAEVAYESDGTDRHTFAAGIEFRPQLDQDAVLGDPTDALYTRDDATDAPDPVASTVFLIDAALTITARGADVNAYRDEAEAALKLLTPKAVEQQLWTGSAWTTPGDVDHQRLADDTAGVVTVVNAGDPLAGDGLAELLDAIADCGDSTRRVIHATPGVVNGWVGTGAVVQVAGTSWLRTRTGRHDVVPGHGYPGTALDGTAPTAGTAWVHVTHCPKIWLGNIDVHGSPGPSGLSRAEGQQENWVRLWAQRPAIVAFDPACHLAAVVTR